MAEAKQQLFAGNLDGTQGIEVLLGDEGQGVVLRVEEADRGHVAMDTVKEIRNSQLIPIMCYFTLHNHS